MLFQTTALCKLICMLILHLHYATALKNAWKCVNNMIIARIQETRQFGLSDALLKPRKDHRVL